jgi:AcrR family transcriptional regulator
MPRVAAGRTEYLTEREIAQEALRQFDEGTRQPSIRQLASALGVSPTAIYHHFPGRAAIIRAAVDLVFEEAERMFMEALPDPFAEGIGPVDILIQSGLATRRAFDRHFRIAPFMAATPEPSPWLSRTLALMTLIFEGLGLEGEDAAGPFHTYCSFVFGAVIVAATRRISDEELGRSEGVVPSDPDGGNQDFGPEEAPTLRALADIPTLSVTDPERDEELFVGGLRRLITSFTMNSTAE